MPTLEHKRTLLQHKIHGATMRVSALDAAIDDTRAKIEKNLLYQTGLGSPRSYLRSVGSNGIFMEMQKHGNKRIHWLEDSRDRTLKGHDRIEAQCEEIKREINRGRREHMLQHTRWRIIKGDLEEARHGIAESMEAASDIMQLKDDIDEEIAEMKEIDRSEAEEFDAECARLSKYINERLELVAFLATEKEKPAGTLTEDEEAVVKEQMNTVTLNMKLASMKENASRRKMASYQAAFERLRQLTGITDIQKLVDSFIDVEDRNFALFRYIQNVNRETKSVRVEADAIQRECADLREAQGSAGQNKRQTIIKLQDKVVRLNAEKEAVAERLAGLEEDMAAMATRVGGMFGAIGCANLPVAEGLNSPHHGTASVDGSSVAGFVVTRDGGGDSVDGGGSIGGLGGGGAPGPAARKGKEGGGKTQLEAVLAADRAAEGRGSVGRRSIRGSLAGSVAGSVRSRIAEVEALNAQPVVESNVLKFLSVIEQRTMEVAAAVRQRLLPSGQAGAAEPPPVDGPTVPRARRQFHIALPAADDDDNELSAIIAPGEAGDDGDGADQHPFLRSGFSRTGSPLRGGGSRSRSRSPARTAGSRTRGSGAAGGGGGGSGRRRASTTGGKADDDAPLIEVIDLKSLHRDVRSSFTEQGINPSSFVRAGKPKKTTPKTKNPKRRSGLVAGGTGAASRGSVAASVGGRARAPAGARGAGGGHNGSASMPALGRA